MRKIGEKYINEKGITLMALVVTIVILIVLAVISLNAIFGENGLIKNSVRAKQEHEKGNAREQLELVLADAYAEKHINQEYNQDEFLDEFVKNRTQGIGETIGDIAIYDGYAFILDRSVPQLGEYVGEKEELVFPEVTASSQNAENKKSSIITIKAKEITNGINKIEILQDGFVIKEYTYENVKDEITENYETNKNGKYNIKVYAKLTANDTVTVEGLIIPVTYTPNGDTTWKKEHSVTVNASEEVEKVRNIKYQWTQTTVEPAENTFTETCNNGDTITKNGITGKWYLWTLLETESGTKVIGKSEAFYFDNQGPEVTLTSTPISENSFELDATGKDAESEIRKYDFYINDELAKTIETNEERVIYTIENKEMGEYNTYVIVTDNAGNETKKILVAKTKLHVWEKWNIQVTSVYKQAIGALLVNNTRVYINTGIQGWARNINFDTSTGKYSSGSYCYTCYGSLYNTYVYALGNSNPNGALYYCYLGQNSLYGSYYRCFNIYRATSELVSSTEKKGSTQYKDVTSADSSEYPTNGKSGSYWYVYKGIG